MAGTGQSTGKPSQCVARHVSGLVCILGGPKTDTDPHWDPAQPTLEWFTPEGPLFDANTHQVVALPPKDDADECCDAHRVERWTPGQYDPAIPKIEANPTTTGRFA